MGTQKATPQCKVAIPEFPICFWKSDVPKILGELATKKAWKACVIPEGFLMPDLRKLPQGLFLTGSRKNYSESQAAHELYHWRMYRIQGKAYIWMYLAEIAIWGYNKAPSEIAAKKAEKAGLSAKQKAWWENLK